MENIELLKIDNENDRGLTITNMEQLDVIEKIIAEKEESIKELKVQQESIKAILLDTMIKYDVKTFNTENYKITRVDETVRNTVDSKALKEFEPEIYNKYLKQSKVKASLRITKLKKESELID